MKLDTLLQARKAIRAHASEALAVPLAYKMMKFMKASEDEEAFYMARLKEVIARYEDPDAPAGQGGEVRIRKDKIGVCNEELGALGATDVSAPGVRFSLRELSELKLSVTEMYALDEFITEEE